MLLEPTSTEWYIAGRFLEWNIPFSTQFNCCRPVCSDWVNISFHMRDRGSDIRWQNYLPPYLQHTMPIIYMWLACNYSSKEKITPIVSSVLVQPQQLLQMLYSDTDCPGSDGLLTVPVLWFSLMIFRIAAFSTLKNHPGPVRNVSIILRWHCLFLLLLFPWQVIIY